MSDSRKLQSRRKSNVGWRTWRDREADPFPAIAAADGQMNSTADPITVSPARLTEILTVSTISAYAAARLAVKGWATLPASAKKAFLYVGNMTNTQIFPETHTLGMAKNAAAYFIETAAEAYKPAGRDYKFYYVDERLENDESVMMDIDGGAHALEFWKLAHEVEGQSHWCWTFVKGDAAKGEAGRYVRNRAGRAVQADGLSSRVHHQEVADM